MLYRLTQEQLEKTLMPLGEYSKPEVRRIAEQAGIEVASKPDSQEICFVTDGNYTDFITEHTEREIPPAGNFVDAAGNVLGKHKGIIHYTVGQRKDLGIALGYPAYVKKICPQTNEVVLGTAEDTWCRGVLCRDMAFMSIGEPSVGEKIGCHVKVRYRHPGESAQVENMGDGTFKVWFEKPVRSAAPGQSAVFYDENGCLVGGGIITELLFDE